MHSTYVHLCSGLVWIGNSYDSLRIWQFFPYSAHHLPLFRTLFSTFHISQFYDTQWPHILKIYDIVGIHDPYWLLNNNWSSHTSLKGCKHNTNAFYHTSKPHDSFNYLWGTLIIADAVHDMPHHALAVNTLTAGFTYSLASLLQESHNHSACLLSLAATLGNILHSPRAFWMAWSCQTPPNVIYHRIHIQSCSRPMQTMIHPSGGVHPF